MMPAYVIARVDIPDPTLLKDYMMATPSIIEKYGGKFLARGGSTSTLEGPTESRRIILIEFPGIEDAKAFYHSPEYTRARQLRNGLAIAEFITVEGINLA